VLVFGVTWGLNYPPLDYGLIGSSLSTLFLYLYLSKKSRLTYAQMGICIAVTTGVAFSEFVGQVFLGHDNPGVPRVFRTALLLLTFFHLANIKSIAFQERTLTYYTFSVLIVGFINFSDWLTGNRVDLVGQNQIALTLTFALAILIWKYDDKNRVIYLPIVLIILFLILLTWSKGAWFTAIIIICPLLLRLIRTNFLLAIILFFSLLLLIYDNYQFIENIILTEFSASEGSSSNEQRLETIIAGLYTAVEYPMGVGGGYEEATRRVIMSHGINLHWIQPDPHNAFLQTFLAGGIIYGFFYVFVIFYPLFLIYKYKTSYRSKLLAFLVVLIFALNGNLNGMLATHTTAWLLLGSLIGYQLSSRKQLRSMY
jgi:hypothetical protein